MIFQDDRTPGQKQTHHVLWGGTDTFLSGWGKAGGGVSYAFWACKPEDAPEMERRMHACGDIIRVREVMKDYRPRGRGHCHIYVHDGEGA